MEFLFWFSTAAVAWSYLGYPLVLLVWSGLSDALGALRFVGGGPDRRASPGGQLLPRISIVFSAFDEEEVVTRKIENCLALDYPADRLEILVGCDGCTDRTAQLAREAGGARVTVHELFPRAGKAAVLSRLVPRATGDLVVLTDANVMLDRGALHALARRFRDGAVGAVVGRLRLFNPSRKDFEETLYWRYETMLKYLEGQRGCVLGANGGIYAIRRLLFAPLEPDTVTDDFVIPMRIALRGWRVPYEPNAVALEETTEDAGREFGRRARIGAGNWQALSRVQGLLDPRTGFPFFGFVSHKLLRWAAPFLLGAALLASLVLSAAPEAWLYRLALLAQLGFYGLAVLGGSGLRLAHRGVARAASVAHYFVSMNAALAVGLWRHLRGLQGATWERTARARAA
ncbi:MAG TPA: glycosyltransferase family 2 protein [Gemmatimonadaceae bacterium]|nr:glycosyltransferase family 2 protein [Gemmatimonadaceae bacterium]